MYNYNFIKLDIFLIILSIIFIFFGYKYSSGSPSVFVFIFYIGIPILMFGITDFHGELYKTPYKPLRKIIETVGPISLAIVILLSIMGYLNNFVPFLIIGSILSIPGASALCFRLTLGKKT